MNAERVRRHRQQNSKVKSEIKSNAQKHRREKERHRHTITEKRSEENNRNRVNSFRIRVQLKLDSKSLDDSPKCGMNSPIDPESAYKHKSSESRAVKRALESIPDTPAKKARILEKIVEEATPRSNQAFGESPTIQAVVNNKTRRKLDTDYEIINTISNEASACRENRLKTTQLFASKHHKGTFLYLHVHLD